MWKKISSFPLRGVEVKLRAHLKLVIQSTELLNDLIIACANYDWAAVSAIAEKIAKIEREADDVKRKIERDLYSGVIFVGLKEDFLRLVETVDEIADKSKDSSRALASRQPEKAELGVLFESKMDIKKLIEGTVDIVKHLEVAIGLLDRNANEALKEAQKVEAMEECLDEQKLEIIKHITQNETKFSTLSYLQIRDFIFLLDMVADAAEEVSDVLTAMIVKSGA
jgi:predicted phosphate transport protein (TIGR00153 family)